jgi:hypothetical protein
MNEILKPGKYFLGDPTSVLPSHIFNGIWIDLYQAKMGKMYINDTHFCIHNTHYGDGIYKDTRNRNYVVDGGVIGLVDISLIEDIKLSKNIGHIFEFKEKIYFYYDIGIFIIKSGKKYIKIDTRKDDEEYDSDEDEVCLDNNNEHISKTFCNDLDDDFIDDINNNFFNDSDDSDEDIEDNKIINKNKVFNFFKK